MFCDILTQLCSVMNFSNSCEILLDRAKIETEFRLVEFDPDLTGDLTAVR